MDRPLESAWHLLQSAFALVVLALFLLSLGGFELGGILSPFLLFWVVAAALHPFRGRPGHALLLTLAAALALLWTLHTTGFLLAPFALSLVLAYILDPVVDRMVGRRIGRSLAILLLALPVLVLLVVAVVFGIPALAAETGELIQKAPSFLSRLVSWLEGLQQRALAADIPLLEERGLLERLRGVDSAAVIAYLEERKEFIFSRVWSGVLGLGRGMGSVLTLLGYVVLTPVLTFYLLRDYDRLVARVAELIPRRAREDAVALAREYDRLVSQYLRGQITVALILGTITACGLLILRFPHAILLGVVVGVFNIVPYLGLVLSLIPALLIALISGNIPLSLLKVAVVYGAAQGLEGAVISPRIVGESVGLHPVWVVLALAVGGFFLGFVGLLLGVPLAVGVKLLLVRGVERYRASDLYRGTAPTGK